MGPTITATRAVTAGIQVAATASGTPTCTYWRSADMPHVSQRPAHRLAGLSRGGGVSAGDLDRRSCAGLPLKAQPSRQEVRNDSNDYAEEHHAKYEASYRLSALEVLLVVAPYKVVQWEESSPQHQD